MRAAWLHSEANCSTGGSACENRCANFHVGTSDGSCRSYRLPRPPHDNAQCCPDDRFLAVSSGPIRAVLYVSSNCTDTDFTVKLTDGLPLPVCMPHSTACLNGRGNTVIPVTGESRLIQDGGVRMRFFAQPLLLLSCGRLSQAMQAIMSRTLAV